MYLFHNWYFSILFYLLLLSGIQNGKPASKRLPAVEKVSKFWCFLEGLLEDIGACENLYSSQPLEGSCPKCGQISVNIKQG